MQLEQAGGARKDAEAVLERLAAACSNHPNPLRHVPAANQDVPAQNLHLRRKHCLQEHTKVLAADDECQRLEALRLGLEGDFAFHQAKNAAVRAAKVKERLQTEEQTELEEMEAHRTGVCVCVCIISPFGREGLRASSASEGTSN